MSHEAENMKDGNLIKCAAIICIAIIVVAGVMNGIDGLLIASGMTIIAGLAGYTLGFTKARKK
jgi:hypothetical protein